MIADYRALCAELADALDHNRQCLMDDRRLTHPLADKARAALAEPEPEVVGPTLQLPEQAPDEHPPSNLDRREVAAWYHGHACGWQAARTALAAEADGPAVQSREPASVACEPSDGDLLQLMPEQFRADLGTVSRMAAHGAGPDIKPGLFRVSLNTGALEYARAVLARWGRPAPAPAGEVAELVAWLRDRAESVSIAQNALRITRAADLLEQLSAQAAPVPVAVSERLPSNADCDSEYRCWIGSWSDIDGELVFDWSYDSPKRYTWEGIAAISCWLPAHALPLPSGEVEHG